MKRKFFVDEQWGIASVTALARRGTRVRIRIRLAWPRASRLRALAPAERLASVSRTLDRNFARLADLLGPTAAVQRIDRSGLDANVAARLVSTLIRMSAVASVEVLAIPGVKRRPEQRVTKLAPTWFSVRGEVVIDIEGRTRGMQSVEDRIVLLRARDEAAARRRFEALCDDGSAPYLNDRGQFVTWRLERIVDVYQLLDQRISPDGTEVYSKFRSRRLRR